MLKSAGTWNLEHPIEEYTVKWNKLKYFIFFIFINNKIEKNHLKCHHQNEETKTLSTNYPEYFTYSVYFILNTQNHRKLYFTHNILCYI